MINQLNRLVQAYDLALLALEVQKKEKVIGNLVTYHDEFTRHIQFQQRMFKKMIDIQNTVTQSIDNDF